MDLDKGFQKLDTQHKAECSPWAVPNEKASITSKRRASDQAALLPAVGVRNGLIAGAAIWLAILTILAGMASS